MPRKPQVGKALLKWLQDTDNFVDVVSWGIRSRVYTLQEGDGGVDLEDMGFKM